jgi:microcystin-dependent protein
LVGIKHHTQGVGVNDPTKQVSITAWQEAHDAGAIADVLTDHNLAAHTTLGLTAAGVPTGTLLMFGNADAPTGYLLCDGQAYDKVGDYTALYNVIGTLYGSDVDHFNVPNLQLKFPLGLGAGKALGDLGGSTTYTHAGSAVSNHDDHTHEFTEIVQHTHPITDNGHVHNEGYRNTGTAGTSGVQGASTANNATIASGCANNTTGITVNNPAGSVASGTTAGSNSTLTHSVTQPNDHTTVQPPYQVVNYIIKT